MKNKYQRIEEYFAFLKQITIENPDFDIYNDSENTIYTSLVRFDVPHNNNSSTLDKDGIFDNWQRRFKNNKNINLHLNRESSDFHIYNKKKNVSPQDYLSIQIPLNHLIIEDGVNLIIDFLLNKKIDFYIKINRNIQSDTIILNINNINHINTICNFIENNKFIQSGLIPPNPFLFIYNGLAISTGNRFSYNKIFSEYIKLYLKEKREQNDINNINFRNFMEFLANYYNETFIHRSNLEKHLKTFGIHDKISISNKIVDYMNLTQLMIESNDPNFDFECFEKHFNQYKDRHEYNKKTMTFQFYKLTEDDINNVNNIIKELIEYLSQDYSNDIIEEVLNAIIYEKQFQYITREKQLRSRISNSNFINHLLIILQNSELELNQYLDKINIHIKSFEEINEEVDGMLTALLMTETKEYDLEYVIEIIQMFIDSNDYRLITRENNLRELLYNNFFRKKLLRVLQVSDISLKDYVLNLTYDRKIALNQYLEKAIMTSYNKCERIINDYENEIGMKIASIDQNSESLAKNFSSIEHVRFALKQLLKNKSYIGFTKEDNVRKDLALNISPEEALKIVRKDLEIKSDNPNPSDEEIDFLVKNYIDSVLERYKIKKILN